MLYINEHFNLQEQYVAALEKLVPNFGYNGFGELVYYRSYSRMILDKKGSFLRQENWHDTVLRVINGVMSIRKDWYTRNHIEWNEDKWQKYAFEMSRSMFKMEWLPPGRGLWAMGTNLIRDRGAMALYNCCFTEITNDWIEELSWLMDTLMYGCGVGFKVVRTGLELDTPDRSSDFVIPDSREGWVDAMRHLFLSFVKGGCGVVPVFDYSLIRPEGSLIKSFGGIASGPAPLKAMLDQMEDLLYRYATQSQDYDEVTFKTDMANLIGVCVVTGNVRRSAELALCDINDPVFMGLKDYSSHPERAAWGWMSNNSVILDNDEDFEKLDLIAEANINGYDIGYVNYRTLPQGRIGKDDDVRYDIATGLNPCQPAWAWVLTRNGLRQFKDIQIGDMIWSETGWTKIVNKFSTGVKEVYRYHTTAGTFYGTENHELVSEHFKIQAKDCCEVDILLGTSIEPTLIDHQAVVDGLVIGDGSFVGETRTVLNIGVNDTDYFVKLKDFIGSQYNKDYQYIVKTEITERHLVHPSKRQVPQHYLEGNAIAVCSFLRGLFSANGSIVGKRVTLKTTSLKLVEQVQMMLSSIGIGSYYTTNKPKLIQHRNGWYESLTSYDISIGDVKTFAKLIGFVQEYKTIILNSIEKKEPTNKKTTYEIISVEYVSEEEVFDITVNNSTHTYWTQGLNVSNCGEIPLEKYEVCNVVETLPTRCVDKDRWLEACEYATFYASTVSLLPTHSEKTNRVIARNRRIGVSIIDFTGWTHELGVCGVTAALREGYIKVRETNKRFADEAGVPESIRVTTMKPGGSTPKLAGKTPGASYPTFDYTLRRIRIQAGTTLERLLKDANIPWEPDAYSKNTTVFEYPIYQGPARPATHVTLWEQAMNLVLLQREWADNMVSNTLYFKPKEVNGVFNPHHEENQIEAVLSAIAPLTKSVSLLPHSAQGAFAQMPEQGITKQEYERRLSTIKAIDWSQYKGSDGIDEKYCEGPSCEIKR